jgi:hypothetical protein
VRFEDLGVDKRGEDDLDAFRRRGAQHDLHAVSGAHASEQSLVNAGTAVGAGCDPGCKLRATGSNSTHPRPPERQRIAAGTPGSLRLGAGRSQVQILSPRRESGRYGAAPLQRTCDHPVICTPSINCTPRRAMFLTEFCKRRIGASLRAAAMAALVGGDARCSSSPSVRQAPPETTACTGSSSAPGRLASSVCTARLHGYEQSARRRCFSRMQQRDRLGSPAAGRLLLVRSDSLVGMERGSCFPRERRRAVPSPRCGT